MLRLIFSSLLILTSLAYSQKTLTIFHINDTHSYVYPWGPKVSGVPQNGSAARLIQRLNQLRSAATNPILLHGGDSFTGDMVFNRFLGRAEFEIFDSIAVSAMVLGNHDFDIRPFRLKNAIVNSGATLDFLSANIRYNNDTSGLSQHVKPFTIKTVGNVLVGIFGLTTTSTVFYGECVPITFDTVTATARRMVDSLKARNVDVIIALTHLGLSEDQRVAQRVSGIDVIVGGHSHTPLSEPVLVQSPSGDTTIIVQAGAKWEYLGTLTLTLTDTAKSWTYQLDRIAAPMPEEPAFLQLLNSYRDSITAVYGSVYSDTVAFLIDELPSVNPTLGNLEFPLLNIVTDAYRSTLKVDGALEVASLMRQNLYSGPVSTAEIRQILSWSYDSIQQMGKRLSVVQVLGSTLRLILNTTISPTFDFLGGGGGFFLALQPSGIQYSIAGIGFYPTLREVWVNNEPIRDDRVYTIAINEFLADLAPRFPFIQFLGRRDTWTSPDQALVAHLRALSPLDRKRMQLGRVWDDTRRSSMTLGIENEKTIVRWNASPVAVAYNLYKKTSGSADAFIQLNNSPILQTAFHDVDASRGQSLYYQLEEIRADSTRFLQLPTVQKVGGLPTSSYLLQNFPNPFNSSTKVVFGLPEKTAVTIRIYNILGQVVMTLLDEEREQGEYDVLWNGADASNKPLSSGVYIIRMTTPTFVVAKRVLVIR